MKKHSHLRAALVTLVAIASIATMSARAEIFTETVGGYTWSYYIENGGARIYKGSGKAAISPVPEGLVEIPDTLDGYPVTSIGSCAFTDCSGMTGVTIPGSVASIGSSAFYNCTNLTSVTTPAGVTSLGR
ncbi:MAG: leucine-rich repeat domain-containing protein, partial [Kiritimatiellae bacterium]|nr:leucine-rich repeat domain-containing protein [Kiritimatiellia bacterium]